MEHDYLLGSRYTIFSARISFIMKFKKSKIKHIKFRCSLATKCLASSLSSFFNLENYVDDNTFCKHNKTMKLYITRVLFLLGIPYR